jgi:AraC-like DNA-binding protein
MQILRDIRLQQAKTAIEQGEQITQVAYSCGFSGYDHFSRSFKEKFGQTPKQCQHQAGGE